VDWGRDLTDVEDDETDAFYDCTLTGYGWMQGYLDRDLIVEGRPIMRDRQLLTLDEPGIGVDGLKARQQVVQRLGLQP
jgi:hypothetical protein